MGVTSRLFLCDQADLDRIRSGERDADDFEGTHHMKGVTNLHLHVVWAAVDGVDWNPDIHAGVALTEGDSWIEHLPPAMVAALASVSDADARRIAAELAPKEDFEWEPDEVETLIMGVRDFMARASGGNVCLETSL